MDNSIFINKYIEKLIAANHELNKKYLILETQFDYNNEVYTENMKELQSCTEKNKILEDELEKLTAFSSDLSAIKSSNENIITSKNEKITQCLKEIENLQNKNLEIANLKKIVSELNAEIAKLQLQLQFQEQENSKKRKK